MKFIEKFPQIKCTIFNFITYIDLNQNFPLPLQKNQVWLLELIMFRK